MYIYLFVSAITRLLELLEAKENVSAEIRQLLKQNRSLLKYKSLRGCRYTPLLHIVKYNKKVEVHNKITEINCIINIEYRMYIFSENKSAHENFLSLFPIAACADFTTLQKILSYFRSIERQWLHDCRNGDTVLHFMIKFGNITHPQFTACFRLLLEEGIDTSRKDYYNNNVIELLESEERYYQRLGEEMNERADTIRAVLALVSENEVQPVSTPKIAMFQMILTNQPQEEFVNNVPLDEDDGEHTLLQLAILKRRDDLVRYLLDNGVNPNLSVSHGNTYCPLLFAVQLSRRTIFQVLLQVDNLEIKNEHFKVISERPKYLNDLLHMRNLNVRLDNDGNIPLFYAICQSDAEAIHKLLKNGSDLPENCMSIINPNHLEEYFNFCLVGDGNANHIDEYRYKLLVVFDFFLSSKEPLEKDDKFFSEVEKVRMLAQNQRLKHLLAHPLIQLLMILKWYCLVSYYYLITTIKFLLYIMMEATLITGNFNTFLYLVFLSTQLFIIWNHMVSFRVTVHGVIELLILITTICMLPLMWWESVDYLKQTTALLVIFISITVLLSLGYHPKLSTWMAMIKRIFRTFTTLLLLFMIPISAFSMSFYYLIPIQRQPTGNKNSTDEEKEDHESDFETIPTSIFRVFVMLSGDIGDGSYPSFISYLVFLTFSVGMAIVIMNFWTGVAISDIKAIEEQSTVAAFQNVIEYIQSLEKTIYMMKSLKKNIILLSQILLIHTISNRTYIYTIFFFQKVIEYIQSFEKIKTLKKNSLLNPFLRTYTISNRKYAYTIEIYLNKEQKVRQEYFKELEIEKELIAAIKAIKCKTNDDSILTEILQRINNLEILLQNRQF